MRSFFLTQNSYILYEEIQVNPTLLKFHDAYPYIDAETSELKYVVHTHTHMYLTDITHCIEKGPSNNKHIT